MSIFCIKFPKGGKITVLEQYLKQLSLWIRLRLECAAVEELMSVENKTEYKTVLSAVQYVSQLFPNRCCPYLN